MRKRPRKTTPSAIIRRQARAAADEVQRRLIADCVCRVIDEQGLEGATLRRIAAELGCTTGMIAHYFSSKDDLLRHALRRALERLRETVAKKRGAPGGLRGQLDAFVDALPFDAEQRVFWRVYVAWRSAIGARARLSPEALRWEQESGAALRDAVARELGLPDASPEVALVADALDAILEGFGAMAAFDPERFSRERVRAMVERCARGLVASARPGARPDGGGARGA